MKHILTLLLVACTSSLFAQNVPADLTTGEFVKDVMQVKYEGENTKLVLWIPQEFWDVAANNDASFKKSYATLIKGAFEDYTIVLAVNSEGTSNPGVHKYPTYEAMKKYMRIKDSEGKEYAPLDDKDISELCLEFKKQMTPILSKMMGDMGSHAYVYIFKSNSKTNYAAQKGSFKIIIDKTEFEWSLPVASLTTAKYCPQDHEKMLGTWLYCPFHGVKLSN